MDAREKFQDVLDFNSITNIPKTEPGYRVKAVRNLVRKGLPIESKISINLRDDEISRGAAPLFKGSSQQADRNVIKVMGLDPYFTESPLDISPQIKRQVLEENTDYRIYTDNFGITLRKNKKSSSGPWVIKYPIHNRNDFYRYRARYDHDIKKRLPLNWGK
jgi:hypothetical protein